MSESAGLIAFRIATEISPIILTGGIAPGGIMPIVALTGGLSAVQQVLTSGSLNLDDFFAHFQVVPGDSLMKYEAAVAPSASQVIAADAVIAQPLSVSMQMICPASGTLGFAVKLATMVALQKVLQQHVQAGGTFSVVTPSYIWTNCIMLSFHDVSGGETQQPQVRWQMDFFQPLTSQQGIQASFNTALQKIASQVDPSLSSASSSSGILGAGNLQSYTGATN